MILFYDFFFKFQRLKKALKKKKWNILEKKSIEGEVRLADIGKNCTQIPPKTYKNIFNKMIRPSERNKLDLEMTIENDDFEIEFDFDFFGQKEEDSVKNLFYIKNTTFFGCRQKTGVKLQLLI